MTRASGIVLETRRRAEGAGRSRLFPVACFVAALAVFALQSAAWPFHGGRDGTTYLMYYADMWNARPAFPQLMLFRTPLAPLLYGPALDLGGAVAAEAVAAFAFAVSVSAFALAASAFGGVAAVGTAAALLLYAPYGALFHQVSSDAAFALAFALWVLAAIRAAQRPTTGRLALAGAGVFMMAMARPSAQLFLLFAVAPLLWRAPWRERAKRTVAFAAPAVVLLLAWAGSNALRYGDFAVARGTSATVPLYRLFVLDHLVEPDNGPASAELAAAVRANLLHKPEYADAGVRTVEDFFATGGDRAWGDLVVLSDRFWGWDSDYELLRLAALEAATAHWKLYARGVGDSLRHVLTAPYLRPATASAAEARRQVAASGGYVQPPEPGGVLWWLATTPDGRIGKGPSGNLVWRSPSDQAHAVWLDGRVAELGRDLPARSGSEAAAQALNALTRGYPWLGIWLVGGIALLLARRPRHWQTGLLIAGLGTLLLVVTMASMPPALEYAIPIAPSFVIATAAGALGRRPVTAGRVYDVPDPGSGCSG